ncbi:hypothetical protein [Rhodoferax sp.]|uniref:hypothetical protein n=1 Tax=Rhodoferax sp. TaxID=50421 RepID=UPI002842A557|nr:hypothetical protein [Rhodoferax sp.]MDR3368784.1 hypothetical protein [Rhodoferax sp.]
MMNPMPSNLPDRPPEAIPQLVAEVFETAPLTLRANLLEQLIKPLGVLALVAISNGTFAKIRFRSGWPDMHVRWEDVQNVQAKDVAALVERVQQVSLHAFDGLAKVVATSPVLAGSAAATVLLTLLFDAAKNRRESDSRERSR